VIELRDDDAGTDAVRFDLGKPIAPQNLAGIDCLVHAAHDFTALRWEDHLRVNVEGSRALFASAREAEVKRILFISTMAAYSGCKSMYGKAKLLVEEEVIRQGGIAVRPGLMWGGGPGGMVGALGKSVARSKLVPLFGGGSQVFYLNHREDLSRFMALFASGEIAPVDKPFTLSCDVPWTFRQILSALAQAAGNRPRFLPVPWQPFYAMLKAMEAVGVHPPFRSDSLLSLMNQDPSPDLSVYRGLALDFRDFDAAQVAF